MKQLYISYFDKSFIKHFLTAHSDILNELWYLVHHDSKNENDIIFYDSDKQVCEICRNSWYSFDEHNIWKNNYRKYVKKIKLNIPEKYSSDYNRMVRHSKKINTQIL